MQYLLEVSYDGKNYYGWAKQPSVPTVCETIEKVTKKIFGKRIQVLSSSRTDRYVHALKLPVLLRGDDSIDKDVLLKELNILLPNDIIVNCIKLVENNFHVRFDAKEKRYRYLTNLKGEGDSNYYNNYSYPFDLEKFKENSKIFIGKKNFASFTAVENYESFERTVNSITVEKKGDILIFEIVGEGFLRFMVRNIVGVLFANNRGKVSDDELKDLFEFPERGKSHYKAVGSGLYLVEVYY